ncbi:MAG: sugar ABC transporter permease [Lachnospiraceae bacterium]|nr:sugar ABC transporter permease [Lachnospiraceae bacterium]
MSKQKKKKGVSLAAKKARMGWVFVSPFVVGFFLFFIILIGRSVGFSFMDVTMDQGGGYSTKWVGTDNFYYMLRVHQYYTEQMLWSVRDMFLNLAVVPLFSLFVAMLLNRKIKGRGLFRAIFFIPVILATGIIAKADALNNIRGAFSNLDMGEITTTAEEMSSAFNSESLMFYLKNVFRFSPKIMEIVENAISNIYGVINDSGVQILIFLSGLQSISPSLYEAAAIEGCSKWESFWKITVPMVSPMILVNFVYTIADSFTKYNNNVMKIIQEEILANSYGYASAGAWIYFGIIAAVVIVVMLIASKFVFYQNRE